MSRPILIIGVVVSCRLEPWIRKLQLADKTLSRLDRPGLFCIRAQTVFLAQGYTCLQFHLARISWKAQVSSSWTLYVYSASSLSCQMSSLCC
jgi:hypothetical protein